MAERMESSARIEGEYRYSLTRIWDADLPRILWVMLNPSTADHREDDPTIRRCIGFSRAWGAGSLEVVNLFALRATDPKAMKAHVRPIGKGNDFHIVRALLDDPLHVVVAWGAHGSFRGRDQRVLRTIEDEGFRPKCLGVTAKGLPRHPLYVKADKALEDFAPTSTEERSDS